jgi:hypothetical protein
MKTIYLSVIFTYKTADSKEVLRINNFLSINLGLRIDVSMLLTNVDGILWFYL